MALLSNYIHLSRKVPYRSADLGRSAISTSRDGIKFFWEPIFTRLSVRLSVRLFVPLSILAATLVLIMPSVHAAPHSAAMQSSMQAAPNQPPQGCIELVKNGDFEASVGQEWEIERGLRPPMPVSDVTHDNSGKAMQIGIVNLANVETTSFVKQTVSLPTGVTNITLTYYYNTRSNPSHDSGDLQFVEIFDNLNKTFLTRFMAEQSATNGWVAKQFDLTPYAGQQISVYFAVSNDGGNGRVAMNIDNVSILACTPVMAATNTPTATVTPTVTNSPTLSPTIDTSVATSTATFTPVPSTATNTPIPPSPPTGTGACQNYLINGDFEVGGADFGGGSGWKRGRDPVQAQLTDAEKYSGNYAARLGNPPNSGHGNQETYSSIRQMVSIPSNVAQMDLRWRHLSKSQEAIDNQPARTSDRMDVIFLEPDLAPIDVIHRKRSKPTGWQIESVPINSAKFSGRNFYVYFNVYNDGNGRRTWSFIDNIELIGCRTAGTIPTPAAAVAAPATATAVPTTAVPATATQRSESVAVANTSTPVPTKTSTKTITDPLLEPQANVAQNKDLSLESSEPKETSEFSITPILPSAGLQVPTTLPTYAPQGSGSTLFGDLFGSSDPDPQPTSTFQWLRTAVSCLLGLLVFVLLIFIAQAIFGKGKRFNPSVMVPRRFRK